MYNVVNTIAPSFLVESSLFLQVRRTIIKSRMSLEFGPIQPMTAELAALDRLEKSTLTYNGENGINPLALSFLIGSSSFLLVIRTTIRVRMNLKFG